MLSSRQQTHPPGGPDRSGPCRFIAWQAALLTALTVADAAAQAVAIGTVHDDSTGRPIRDAEVVIEALGRRTTTDAQGRFVLAGLAPGVRMLLVRAVGYSPFGTMVQLSVTDTARREIRLEPVVVHLEPIEVSGTPPRRPRGVGREAFEERRRLGFGQFIDSAMLRQSEYLHVTDVLRRHSSVHIRPLGSFGGGMAMSSRYRDRYGQPDCYMQIVLDGVVIHKGGRAGADAGAANAPNLKHLLDVSGLEAVEVYRSAAEVPTEYGGASAACGVILFWTRRAP